jgi:hypothetical protein
MEGSAIQPVMDINRGYGYGDGLGFGGSGLWLFAILALMWGGNGLWGGNGAGNSNAIQADVNRGFDNQNLQAQTRDILTAVTSGTAQTQATSNANTSNIINSIKDGNASLIREFGNVETSLTALGGNMQNCCCAIQRNIDGVNYNQALNTASINATTTAQTQKILDALAQNKIDALQNKVNQLELQNAVAGVVRYPTSTAYCSGSNPFCGCGCNGQAI